MWESPETNRVRAEHALALRNEAQVLRQQGQSDQADEIDGYLDGLPWHPLVKTDPQAYLDRFS